MNQSNIAGHVVGGQEGTVFRAANGSSPRARPSNWAKRALDITVAGIALLLFLIPIAVLTALVRVKLGGPAFFRQTRPGLKGVPFQMVKFRTMTEERGADGQLLPDADRLTSFGKFLRSTSLDELPELWNVLKGDMSLVGPRPLLMEYLPLYDKFQARRHEVRPGITGWAQVNGRNSVDWDDRFRLDVWYVNHRSLGLDLKVLWLTLWCVIARDGISAPGESTMSKFAGSTLE
jgi:lipopolysaccharide/colanic/teichoic acid biosynthesis glycosyltransferase